MKANKNVWVKTRLATNHDQGHICREVELFGYHGKLALNVQLSDQKKWVTGEKIGNIKALCKISHYRGHGHFK